MLLAPIIRIHLKTQLTCFRRSFLLEKCVTVVIPAMRDKCDICNVLCNFCTSVSRRFSAIITIAIKYAGIKNARSRETSFAKTPRKVNYGL